VAERILKSSESATGTNEKYYDEICCAMQTFRFLFLNNVEKHTQLYIVS
jgi:hypothetical protein